jgi:hypothetical protein
VNEIEKKIEEVVTEQPAESADLDLTVEVLEERVAPIND